MITAALLTTALFIYWGYHPAGKAALVPNISAGQLAYDAAVACEANNL